MMAEVKCRKNIANTYILVADMKIAAHVLRQLFCLSFLIATPVLAGTGKVALVFGDTQVADQLENNYGFDVDRAAGLGVGEIENRLEAFGKKAAGAEMAVLYYRGSSAHTDRASYFQPESMSAVASVKRDGLLIEGILKKMASAKASIALIDTPTVVKSVDERPGADVKLGPGALKKAADTQLVVYTMNRADIGPAAGEEASIGAALVKRLSSVSLTTAAVKLTRVASLARDDVIFESGGAQVPWMTGSLPDTFELRPFRVALKAEVEKKCGADAGAMPADKMIAQIRNGEAEPRTVSASSDWWMIEWLKTRSVCPFKLNPGTASRPDDTQEKAKPEKKADPERRKVVSREPEPEDKPAPQRRAQPRERDEAPQAKAEPRQAERASPPSRPSPQLPSF